MYFLIKLHNVVINSEILYNEIIVKVKVKI